VGWLETSCSDVCEIFSTTRYDSEPWKKWSGREFGRPGKELDEKSMAWNAICCLG